MAVSRSAIRQRIELPANASMARAVSSKVRVVMHDSLSRRRDARAFFSACYVADPPWARHFRGATHEVCAQQRAGLVA